MDGRRRVWTQSASVSNRLRYAVTVAMLAACVTVCGCSHATNWLHNGFKVGPDYHAPSACVSSEWIDFNDPRVISDACHADDPAWWSVFDDPNLDQFVQTAYSQNLPLQVAAWRVQEAEGERAIAAGRLFPQFQEAFGNFQQTQHSSTGYSMGLPSSVRALGVWSTGFNASWEFDVWGRYRRAIESADANVDASIASYDDVLVTLIADVAATYIEMRAFQQRLQLAEANVATQEKSLQLAQARFDSGLAAKLDVTQAKASLYQTRSLLPVLKRGRRWSNNRLCVLLGIPPQELEETPQRSEGISLPEPPPRVVVGIPANLMRRRPDIREAEREVAKQSALIGVAAADLFPRFQLTGSIRWEATHFDDLLSPATTAGMFGPAFNWDVLNYGRLENNVAVQDARFQRLIVAYRQVVLKANREVEDAIVDFLRSRDRVEELTKTVEAATESVELAQVQYNKGLIDFDRVNNLQRDLVIQQDDAVTARADVAFALIHLYRALGGGWQLRCVSESAESSTES